MIASILFILSFISGLVAQASAAAWATERHVNGYSNVAFCLKIISVTLIVIALAMAFAAGKSYN